MLSHRNIVTQMRHCMDVLSWCEGDERLAFLPACHVAERVAGMYYAIATGVVSNYAERPETVPEDIREVQPTLFGAVPRVWERFYSAVMIALKDATPLERWAYRLAMVAGNRVADARLDHREPGLVDRIGFTLAYFLVLRNIRRMIGIDRCRWLFTGAAPIAPELIRWYLALGMRMYEVYGQTENAGLATVMPMQAIKLGTVGKPVPYGEVSLSGDGEILIRGEFVFMGYLNQPEKTAETVDRDGWLHTGDVGLIDNEGYVRITDRMKDIIITAGGKNIVAIDPLLNFAMFKAFIPAIVLTASLCSAAHADQEDSRTSQPQDSQVQQHPSAPAVGQAPGLTRAQVYDQLVQAEKDGSIARRNATLYKGR